MKLTVKRLTNQVISRGTTLWVGLFGIFNPPHTTPPRKLQRQVSLYALTPDRRWWGPRRDGHSAVTVPVVTVNNAVTVDSDTGCRTSNG